MTINRRNLLAGAGAGLLVAPRARAAGPGLRAVALRTAGMTDPLGIGDENPMLSWRVEGPPGTEQAACRIRVASDRARLLAGNADLWDSGRIATPVSTGLRYAGAPPGSRRRCHWQVRVWDAAGSASPWSAPAVLETGLLADDDWAGAWLAAESADERDDRLTLSEIYAGEDHDRRLWPRGWSSPGFDDRDWDRAWPAPAPAARPQAPAAPPIRVTRTLRPVAVRRIGPCAHLADFG